MKKVYIIGAGASQEVGFPIGSGLLKKIRTLIDYKTANGEKVAGDDLILSSFHELSDQIDLNDFIKESRHICDTVPLHTSIDRLIHTNQGNETLEKVAKLSIVRVILDYEHSFRNKYHEADENEKIDFNRIENTWFVQFIKIITEGCNITELINRLNNITLIVFNYDRCIEHILFQAIQKKFRLPNEQAAAIIDGIKIIHPYGKVGNLPMSKQISLSQVHDMKFGDVPTHMKLVKLVDNIKTFTEGVDEKDSEIALIRKNLQNAERVVFLGFGFDSLNMELLSSSVKPDPYFARRCFFTSYGITKGNFVFIENKIKKLLGAGCVFFPADKKCNEFMHEFSEALSIINEG